MYLRQRRSHRLIGSQPTSCAVPLVPSEPMGTAGSAFALFRQDGWSGTGLVLSPGGDEAQVTTAPSAPISAHSRSASVSILTSSSVATPSLVIWGRIVRISRAMDSYPGQSGPPPAAASRCISGAGSPAPAKMLRNRRPMNRSIPARR